MSEIEVPEALKRNSGGDPTGQKLLKKIKDIDPSTPDEGWNILHVTVAYIEDGWVRFNGSQERH